MLERLRRDERSIWIRPRSSSLLSESPSRLLYEIPPSKRPLLTSALARTEVARALLPAGPEAVSRGFDVLRRIDVVRLNDRILNAAGTMLPADLRSLDAIHLAPRTRLVATLAGICTYDERLAAAAKASGLAVVTPI